MRNVKVNKETFDALKFWENGNINPLETALDVRYSEGGFFTLKLKALNELSIECLCKCFINGYELLEETPEEELSRVFNMENITEIDIGFNKGMLRTLNVLGIKIKGINS